jgi:two-component sensor histidine kinase
VPSGENWYRLTVSDNGKGFPEDLDFRKTESLGLKIVYSLTEQLGGSEVHDPVPGGLRPRKRGPAYLRRYTSFAGSVRLLPKSSSP